MIHSTGCIETSEAIMGVTKVLMASNDTLFNFEDTLGDREDMLSPRNNSNNVHATSNTTISNSVGGGGGSGGGVGSNTFKSTTPQPENCRTPTNEAYLAAYPVEYKPNDLNSDNHMNNEIRPNSLQLNFENLTNNLGDLLSPEQQKTFSEEINTIEQLSSDLSATIDATNTLDDLKTCISVHTAADDVRLNEDSGSDAVISIEKQSNRMNSPIENVTTELDDSVVLVNDTLQTSMDVDEPTVKTIMTIEEDQIQPPPPPPSTSPNDKDGDGRGGFDVNNTMSANSSEHLKQSDPVICDLLEPIENAKENKSPNLDFQAIATKPEIKSNLNKTNELSEIGVKIESVQPHNDLNHLNTLCEPTGQLSGEEDPWVNLFYFIYFFSSCDNKL